MGRKRPPSHLTRSLTEFWVIGHCRKPSFNCPSSVHTDAWASYTALGKMGIDHRPRKGGHGRHAVDGLPWADTVFGNLKTWLRGTFHGVSPKHLQSYLDESVFRFDRRWKEKNSFHASCAARSTQSPSPITD